MIEDVGKLMECPFTFDEFVQMEAVIFELFEWNMQIPTIIEIIQTILAQGVVFTSDTLILPIKDERGGQHQSSPDKYKRVRFTDLIEDE